MAEARKYLGESVLIFDEAVSKRKQQPSQCSKVFPTIDSLRVNYFVGHLFSHHGRRGSEAGVVGSGRTEEKGGERRGGTTVVSVTQSGGLVSPKGVVEGCGRDTLKIPTSVT